MEPDVTDRLPIVAALKSDLEHSFGRFRAGGGAACGGIDFGW